MLLQGDSLAVQLFVAAAAISVLSVAMTQAGWTYRWLVGGLFGLAALLAMASAGWRYIEARIPLLDGALQIAASSRVGWFFAGIVPALVTGMLLSDLLRRHRKVARPPRQWVSVLAAKDRLARQDLIDRHRYVSDQFHDALTEFNRLAEQTSDLERAMPFVADDSMRSEAAKKYVELSAEKDAIEKKYAEWERTLDVCSDVLREDIKAQLLNGKLIAKGFLAPHTPGDPERIIPMEEWRFLILDDEDQALGPNFEYIALLIGKPGH
jgi:hypothetical protein